MTTDNKLRIIENDDVKGLINEATATDGDLSGGGRFDPNTAQEQLKKALARKGIVEFTNEEIKAMPKTFRRLIIIQNKRCRLRTHASGKTSQTYEIRFRRDGYDISASGKTIELAKANFIAKLKNAKPIAKETGGGSTNIPTTFNAFALYYFEAFRREKVTERTLQCDMVRYNKHLAPRLKETPLADITPSDCKKILNDYLSKGQSKTAMELRGLLSVIFKSAIAHALIDRNPLDVVSSVQHERQSGKALSKDEELCLLNDLPSAYKTAAALALYCGLRPNELKTVQIRDRFIVAINSKRKSRKTEYKRIPIIDRLRPFLPEGDDPQIPNIDNLRKEVKRVLPGHKLYDLRTTFYTRCDEYGVAPPARDEFVGHSGGALTNAYRDLSDEYLLKEADKLNAW